MAEYRTAICTVCGRTFRYDTRTGNARCKKCYYDANYRSTKKPKAEHKSAMGIDDVIREQQRIRERTGKILTYGEIMAARGGKKT